MLPDEAREAFAARATPRDLAAGEVLIREGSEPSDVYLVVAGELESRKRTASGDTPMSRSGPGALIGEMALLADVPRSATVVAATPARVLVLDRASFDDLLVSTPAAARAVLRLATARLRRTEEVLVRGEQLASLGRIAGGLAHELNNPATAVQRAAAALADHVAALGGIEIPAREPVADPLAREEVERALAGVLESAGIAEAWDLAPALAARGLVPEDLAGRDPAALRRLGHVAAAARAVAEMREGTRRIAELIAAVQTHARRDGGDVVELDVGDGIARTLLLLGHRLRDIRVTRAIEPARVRGRPSELAQVWTNLIDNAIDAMAGRGSLAIAVRTIADRVEVAITDSGTGLADDARAHLFEPFFTTKPPGVGTGLGLSISRQIVVERHGGHIEADTGPGGTTFRVVLPRA